MPVTLSTFKSAAIAAFLITVGTLATVAQAQSFGVVDPRTVGRDYRSLDQIYAVAPSVIQGRQRMSRLQYALVSSATPVANRNLIAPSTLTTQIVDQNASPIIESIDQTNWIWLGTTAALSAAGGLVYLFTRP